MYVPNCLQKIQKNNNTFSDWKYEIQATLFISKIDNKYFCSTEKNVFQNKNLLTRAIQEELKMIPQNKKELYIQLLKMKFTEHLGQEEQSVFNFIIKGFNETAIINEALKI